MISFRVHWGVVAEICEHSLKLALHLIKAQLFYWQVLAGEMSKKHFEYFEAWCFILTQTLAEHGFNMLWSSFSCVTVWDVPSRAGLDLGASFVQIIRPLVRKRNARHGQHFGCCSQQAPCRCTYSSKTLIFHFENCVVWYDRVLILTRLQDMEILETHNSIQWGPHIHSSNTMQICVLFRRAIILWKDYIALHVGFSNHSGLFNSG